jgi:hypothetical protein
MSPPKRYPAPLGLILHELISSGSDHIKSHIAPSCGTSYFLSITLISSRVDIDGERPPWTQKIFSSMIAASGR